MATYNLGRIALVPRGQWEAYEAYSKLDVVSFDGSSYLALSSSENKRPDVNPDCWMLIAERGKQGDDGAPGPTYKAGRGINIENNTISVTEERGEGGTTSQLYFPGFGVEFENGSKINAEVEASNDMPTSWEAVSFVGMPDGWNPKNVFRYDGNTYYSDGAGKHFVLNGTVWDAKYWDGFSEFTGEDIYVNSRGELRYYNGNTVMLYDNVKKKWEADSCNIPNPKGRYIFRGNEGYSFYAEGDKCYKVHDSSSLTWESVKWNREIYADKVWSDGDSIYYSNKDNQCYYDQDRNRWFSYEFRGVSPLGNLIWKQGKHIFYSNGANTYSLAEGDKWERIDMGINIAGNRVWSDGENVYYEFGGTAYKLIVPEMFYVTRHEDRLVTERELNAFASKLPKFSIEVVTELPAENISDTTVYLIPSSSSTSGNLYDEYIYVNKKWELLGSQSVDLSGYAKKSDIPTVPTKVSAFENDADYAKKSELPSTAGLLTEAKAADTYQPKGNYLTEHQSLAEYAKKSEIPTVPTKVSAFENDAEYLTEHQDISGKLNVSGSNGTSAGVSALINKLSSATSTPQDADYYVCQYAGGGTTTTTYYRRSMAALWKWIKTKTDAEYRPIKWTPLNAASGAASGALVIIGTITHTPISNKSWQITIRMIGKHGGTYYGDTTVRLAGTDSSTQVNIKEISFVAGSISVPGVRAYRVSDTEIAIGVSKSNSWTGMDCIIENLDGTDFVTSTAEETKSYNASYLLTCNAMPWNQNTKSMKVVYEDGTEETFSILIKG